MSDIARVEEDCTEYLLYGTCPRSPNCKYSHKKEHKKQEFFVAAITSNVQKGGGDITLGDTKTITLKKWDWYNKNEAVCGDIVLFQTPKDD